MQNITEKFLNKEKYNSRKRMKYLEKHTSYKPNFEEIFNEEGLKPGALFFNAGCNEQLFFP